MSVLASVRHNYVPLRGPVLHDAFFYLTGAKGRLTDASEFALQGLQRCVQHPDQWSIQALAHEPFSTHPHSPDLGHQTRRIFVTLKPQK